MRELAETRIRNLQAFRELKELNDHGRFQYKHPLIMQFSLRKKLLNLYQQNPDVFLDEYARARDNVKRYNSLLNKKTRTEMEKERDQNNLAKYQEREQLMKDIVKGRS